MNRFAQVPRPQFGRRAGADEPARTAGQVVRGVARRQAMLAEAAEVLTHLPGPGEALHSLITGRYDLMHLLVILLDKLGPAQAVRIATLSYNERNLEEMTQLLDGKKTKTLTLLCSAFFRDHNKGLFSKTLEVFRDRRQRAAATRTHCKVIAIETTAGIKLALEGSANLRSNSNLEQFALIADAGLHDWHAKWMDDLVTTYEAEAQSKDKA